jgi:hypothetical protein
MIWMRVTDGRKHRPTAAGAPSSYPPMLFCAENGREAPSVMRELMRDRSGCPTLPPGHPERPYPFGVAEVKNGSRAPAQAKGSLA